MGQVEFKKVDIHSILDKVIEKTLGEVDTAGVFGSLKEHDKVTGIAGTVIEKSVLKYPINNSQEPDIIVDGVETEVKATGIRMNKRGSRKYKAKEPMSVTAVSVDNIAQETFETSNFWHKLAHLLLVFYDYDSYETVKASGYANFRVKGYCFYEFSEEDRKRLQHDWNLIHDYIVSVQTKLGNPDTEYPKISSLLRSELVLIDTAPKWPHKPRFRIKRHVVSRIVEEHFYKKSEIQELEELTEDYISYQDVDSKLSSLSAKHMNKSINELANEFSVEMFSKNVEGIDETIPLKALAERIAVKMLGGTSLKLRNIEFFFKFGLIAKTITLTSRGLRTEDMKLMPIDFHKWLEEETEFESSSLYEYFANHQFIFIIYKEIENGRSIIDSEFVCFKRMKFSEDFILNQVRELWEKVRALVANKELKECIVNYKNTNIPVINKNGIQRTRLNFPKSKDNVLFVRGTSSNSSEKKHIVNGIAMYRQNVWIKGSFIVEELNKVSSL